MDIKPIITVVAGMLLLSCRTTIKFSIPQAFREQADMQHVSGTRGNKMQVSSYNMSRIKRGVHLSYPGWNRGFTLENLLLNEFGLEKKEHVKKEKARFRFTMDAAAGSLDVFGREQQVYRSIEYKKMGSTSNIFNSWERVQEFNYIFTAVIHNASYGERDWELLMSNVYDRRKDTVNSFFTVIPPGESGMATNGRDTFYIKPVSTRKTENEKGKAAMLPFEILSGYELRTSGGVIGIVDLVGSNIWFYNGLDPKERLVVAAIGASIFARRVSDTKW